MRHLAAGVIASLVAAVALPAQMVVNHGPEIRTFAGAFVPTGPQKTDFKTAEMFGLQVAQELSSNLHLLATGSFTHGHNKYTPLTDDRTFIWQYDVGVELNALHELDHAWLFRPLVGFGFGARTYDYQVSGLNSYTCTAGYAAAGTEFQRNVMAIRFEARDYVNCFKSPLTAKKSTRNDMGLSLGLVYHIR